MSETTLKPFDLREAQTAWRRANVPARHAAALIDIADSEKPTLRNPVPCDGWDARCGQLIEALLHGPAAIHAALGPRGTGKTLSAAMAIQAVVRAAEKKINYGMAEPPPPARYTTARAMFAEMREAFGTNAKKSERAVLKSFTAPDFLVIDELHEMKGSDWEAATLTSLIDDRYNAMRQTLLVSNQPQADFIAGVGPSIASRMQEGGGIFLFSGWPSFRGRIGNDGGGE